LRQVELPLHGLPLLIRKKGIDNCCASDYEREQIERTVSIPPTEESFDSRPTSDGPHKYYGYIVFVAGVCCFGIGLFGVFPPQLLWCRCLSLPGPPVGAGVPRTVSSS
jgi:hypothetical protein